MATNPEKTVNPPVVSFKTFTSFLNQLRDHGTVPTRVDKSLMPRVSGSQQAAILAALRFFSLIDSAGKPSANFSNLVLADDDKRKPMYSAMIKESYAFIFEDKEFDLEKATSGEMAEKFKGQNLHGSTVIKTIQFFLYAAKEAGITVSSHIKPPSAPKPSNGGSRKPAKAKDEVRDADDEGDDDEDDDDVEKFEVPIPGKRSVKVIVPSDLDADDWEMLQSMINVYIKRWKGFKDKKENE